MAIDLSRLGGTVRVIGEREPNRSKVGTRGPIGTGFLVSVPSERHDDVRYGYVATAHHVIEDRGTIEIQAPDPANVSVLQEPVEVDGWEQPLPSVDLVVALFGGAVGGKWGGLALDIHCLPPDYIPQLGSTIFYIGILEPLNTPMVRSGTLGTVAYRGLDHQGGYEYEVDLVDCRSYGGFSGSPCFVEFLVPRLEAEPLVKDLFPFLPEDVERGSVDHVTMFCGMFTSHFNERTSDLVSKVGVGVMLPWRLSHEALTTPELREARRVLDARLA